MQKAYLKLLFAALLLIVSLSSGIYAQDKNADLKKVDEGSTIRVDTDLVSIDVSVADRAGNRNVTGLRAEDFVVYEDGLRQKVTNFSLTSAPFSLVLLIDTSGSAREDLVLIRRAAKRFLEGLRPNDRIAVIQFNKEVELILDLTADRLKIEDALNKLKGGSGTSFYDSLQLTIDEVMKKVEGRKAVVALTDGVDSYGFNTFEQIMPALEKDGASVYFLELDTESFTEAGMMRDCSDARHFKFSTKQLKKYVKEYLEGGDAADYEDHCALPPIERMQINRRLYQSARSELREIAKRSGGRVFPVKSVQQLEPAYLQIADELRTQYSLAYYPTNDKHDGKWRTLRIEVKKSGIVATAKPGYRAPLN